MAVQTQVLRFNLIGAYLSHDGLAHPDGDIVIPAKSVYCLAEGLELKVKITNTAITHGNSRYTLGFVEGEIKVSGSLVTPKDTDELDGIVNDSINGCTLTIVGVGKLNDNGATQTVVRIIGAKIGEFDKKHQGSKETTVTVSFDAITWTTVETQVIP